MQTGGSHHTYSWRTEYPSDGVFEVTTFSWDKDELAVDVLSDYRRLPVEYNHATRQNFWDEVCSTVLTACPGCTRTRYLFPDEYALYFKLGSMDGETRVQTAIRVKELLDQRAQQIWVRPGVPRLFSMVLKCLSSRGNLVTSLMEFQQRHGLTETRQVVDEFSDHLLSP